MSANKVVINNFTVRFWHEQIISVTYILFKNKIMSGVPLDWLPVLFGPSLDRARNSREGISLDEVIEIVYMLREVDDEDYDCSWLFEFSYYHFLVAEE